MIIVLVEVVKSIKNVVETKLPSLRYYQGKLKSSEGN